MRRLLVVTLALFVVGCDWYEEPTAPAGPEMAADAAQSISDDGRRMRPANDYVVLLGSDEDPASVARDHGVSPTFTYHHVVRGFSGSISDLARQGLLADGRVRDIVADEEFSVEGETVPAPSWGLDRVDQRTGPLDGQYGFIATGQGVTAYVVDTGIRYTHDDFGGRASFGFDSFGGDGSDCHGHGTHVAGTIGGSTYGVAKGADLVAVRVLNCTGSGTTSTVIAGLDWVAANGDRPAVVNMSLGGGASDAVDEAVRAVISTGIPVVVAAGNAGDDACDFSPARVGAALTIGATTSSDSRSSWSNWGLCVDWFAPGSSITSAGHSSDGASAVKSGTSMAAPHVAGAAALYLETHPSLSPSSVATALASMTTKGVVSGSFSPNSDLLYTVDDGSEFNWSNALPVADFTWSCVDLECQFTDGSTDSDGEVVGWQWMFGDGWGELKQNPAHTYAAAGTYDVTLIAKDDDGATSPTTYEVVVGSDPGPEPPQNAAPVAGFSASCDGLTCGFTDESTDSDGTVVAWAWTFGDGGSAAVRHPTHSYAAAGTYAVTLTAEDDQGATNAVSLEVTVEEASPPPPQNSAPVASFTSACEGLSCTFTDASEDADGAIHQWEWHFGDGSSAVREAGGSVQHDFPTGGTFQVTLTVTDDAGATDTEARSVEVTDGGLSLKAVAGKDKGRHLLDLTWSGATTSEVAVYVTGYSVVTVPNTGSYGYQTENRGKGSYLVWVCEVGTGVCSAEKTVEY